MEANKLRMRGNLVGVEKLGKSNKKDTFLEIPDSADSIGIILYVSENADKDLKVGDKVYFGDRRTQITVGGKDVLVMSSENVVAVVQE